MAAKGLTILRNGYPIIPLIYGEKRPAIDGWRTVTATAETVSQWHGGIGIRTGEILLIDVDVPNAVADRIRALCLRLLGHAPIRVGNPPKLGLMYRAATLFRTHLSTVYRDHDDQRCALEGLADGRQFVAHNRHPITGKPYFWLEGFGPEDIPADDLTVVTEAQILDLFRRFDIIAREEGWTRFAGSSATAPTGDEMPAARHREPIGLTDERIRSAVLAIPNDRQFDAREDWFKIGAAIHHETGGSEVGREIFNEWSEAHPTHDEGLFRKAWDSMGTRYDDPSYAPITFRYIQGILKDQRKAELAKRLTELHWAIDLAGNLEELEKAAMALAGLDVEPVKREAFAGHIREVAKRLGLSLSIGTIRGMLRPRDTEIEMPGWLDGWVFLKETGQFYNISTGEYVERQSFDLAFSPYVFNTPPSRFAVQVAKIPVYRMTAYLPGKDQVYTDPTGLTFVNTYREFAPTVPDAYTDQDRANIEIVKNHAVHLFGNRERDIAILHSALAYIVQTRHRINWLILIQGAEQIGKTFYAQLLRAVLGAGPHVHELTTEILTESHFTDWAEGHLVVYIEELMLHGKRYDVLNKMKPYIANESINAHGKYRKSHDVLNTTTYFAFTNYRNAVPIDDGDTRYFVLLSRWQNSETVRQFKAANPTYYPRLWNALTESPGALRRWLLEYELHPDFNPNDRAPPSHGREMVIREGKPDLQHQIEDLLEEGKPGIRDDLVITHILRAALADESGMLPTPEAIRTMLRRLQFTPVHGGRIKITDASSGIRQDFYCWSRNQETVDATTGALREKIINLLA
jgi:hypothetical protein